MSLRDNEACFSQVRVIPVLTPMSVTTGVAVSRILFDAGLRMQEITLRTKCGLETIAALRHALPKLIVGAGSVLTAELGESAIQSGAHFLISPGTPAELLQYAADCEVPFLPGLATVSEIMQLQSLKCRAVKIFPAQPLGGAAYLRSLRGPLPLMRFCPTGGIDAQIARDYLQLPNVLAVGGSWMVPDGLIATGRYEEIRRLAEEAAALS